MSPWWLIAIAYLLQPVLTKSTNLGDTKWYARNIVSFAHGDFHEAGSRLWEFGHLIWRPLGYLVYQAAHPFTSGVLGWSDYLTARTALVAVGFVCGLLLAIVFQSLAECVSGSRGVGLLTAILLIYSNAFLTFAAAGSSYIPGLLFLTLALRIAVARQPSALKMGLCMALSMVLWFPYVLSLPAVAIAALIWNRSDWSLKGPETRARLLWTGKAVVITVVVVGLLYGIGIMALGFRSAGDVGQWVRDSQHGWAQNRTALRLVSGLPRAFISMGQDTLLFKRFALHDPYAPVTKFDLLRSSLWKLASFYFAVLSLAWTLLRKRGLVALAVLAAGAAPVLGFALFFESGSLERFLALYPFLDLSIAVALAMVPAAWGARVIVVFLATAAISDVHDIWRPRIEADQRRTLARALSLEANAHNGEIWMTSLSDKLIWAEDAFPFEDRTSLRDLQLDPVVQIGTTNVAHWRRDFALRSLGAWDSGRTVWLSRRLLADRPRPEWGWTEGETPDVSWNALRDFSRVLETDRDEGGDDGFLRLADTPANRHSLAALAAGPR